jgi:hypothetical protein
LDGWHLGCSGTRSFSRRGAGGGPARESARRKPNRSRGRTHEFIRVVRQAHRARRRKRLPLRRTRQARHEVSERHRVGAKPPPRAIAAGGCLSSRKRELPRSTKTRPLTRDNSALRSSICLAHARVVGNQTADRRRLPLCWRKPVVGGAGAGDRWSDGRACGSFRWQKSTNGAWPRAPAGDEPAVAARSSPLPGETGERAKERRKPCVRRQSRRGVAGPRSRFGAQAQGRAGNSSMEGVRRALDASPLTRWRGRCPRAAIARFGVRSSSSGRQREECSPGARKTTPHDRGCRPRGFDRILPRNGRHPQSRTRSRKRANGSAEATNKASRSSVERRQAPPTRALRRGFLDGARRPSCESGAEGVSGFARSHDSRCTCTRVGCRSR